MGDEFSPEGAKAKKERAEANWEDQNIVFTRAMRDQMMAASKQVAKLMAMASGGPLEKEVEDLRDKVRAFSESIITSYEHE